jgi:uncharacterized protein YuzE
MKATYDAEVDVVMVYFASAKYDHSEEIYPGMIADFDANGRIISLEILNAGAALAEGALTSIPPPVYAARSASSQQ